jgi:HlyD family secretion protein
LLGRKSIVKKSRVYWLIALALIVVVGGYFIYTAYQKSKAAAAASIQTVKLEQGTISAVVDATGSLRTNQSALVAWQTSGRVEAVNVKLGSIVKTGDVLASLEMSSLNAGIIQAQADLAAAQDALDTLMTSTTPQAQALKAVQDAQTALDSYNYNFPATQAKAQADLLTAQTNLTTMTNRRTALNYARASQSDIDAAEARYNLAQQAVDNAQRAFNRVSDLKPTDPLRSAAQVKLADAEKKRDAALVSLNWYLGTPTNDDIAKADANLGQAQADLAQAQDAWNLVKDGPNPTQLAILEAQLADAKRKYEQLKDGPTAVDIQAAQTRILADQATLSVARLVAPFDGTITEVDVMPGDLVRPGDLAFQIDDVSSQYVDLEVSEVDINKVKLAQSATLTFDAVQGKQYAGVVDRVGQVSKVNAGAVNYIVTVKLTDPDAHVRPGMTASASILVGEKKGVLLVPSIAVRFENGKTVIDVLRGGKVVPVPVQTGLASDTQTEIVSGDVKAGDDAVVSLGINTLLFGGPQGGGGSFGGGSQ